MGNQMEQTLRKSYKVGQTIFIVASSKGNIAPAKIIAKHTTEHETGVSIRHTCQTENDPQAEATFELESLYKRDPNISCFESLEEAEGHLLQIASNKIKHLVAEVRKKISHSFYSNQQKVVQQFSETQENPVDEIHAIMTLEDGTRVRVPRDLIPEA